MATVPPVPTVPAVAPVTPEWNPIRYELRIGVTGHRTLANPQGVEDAVRALLDKVVATLQGASLEPYGPCGSQQSAIDWFDHGLSWILSKCSAVVAVPFDALADRASKEWRWPRVPVSPAEPSPSQQTPLKLTVISCLAKGADQIVARVVCDMVTDKKDRNRYLEAVLPFPASMYEVGFDEADLTEFRRLLELDRGNLKPSPLPTVLYPEFAEAEPAGLVSRDDAYAAAGRHVVNTAEVIVAVWDPEREEHAGGTAETVRYAVAQGRTVLWINPAHLESDPALLKFESTAHTSSTPAERESRGRSWIGRWWRRFWYEREPETPPGTVSFTSGKHRFLAEPVPARAKALSRNFHRLAAYNRDGVIALGELRKHWSKSAVKLRKTFEGNNLPGTVTKKVVNVLLPHYERANHAAVRYQALRNLSARLWPVTAAVLVTGMAFQIMFFPTMYWLAIFEVVVLSLGYAASRVSLYDAWHAKWLNDRRLAEGMRGAIFSALLPRTEEELLEHSRRTRVGPSVVPIQNPLPFYSPATAWFVDSLKRMIAKETRDFATDVPLGNRTEIRAVADVLHDAWLGAQRSHHQKKAGEQARLAIRGDRVRLGMIVALIVVAILHAFGVGHHDGTGGSWVGFFSVAFPSWAAAFHVMLSLDDHERLAERSTQMAYLLAGLSDELKHVETLEQLRATVREAERVMDFESAEWAESLIGRKPEFTG